MIIPNKAFINGKIYNVVESISDITTEFMSVYDNIAIHYNGFILPLYYYSRTSYCGPGMYADNLGGLNIIEPTTPEEAEVYSDLHLAGFSNAESFSDILKAREKICEDEYNHLISSDEVFTPVINQVEDTNLMIAVKSAIAAKECNINKYAERFGSDFNNDKRQFNKNKISVDKAESILSKTDIRVTLVVQDMTPGVANPIGKTLVFPWIGDGVNDDKYKEYIEGAINSVPPIKLGGE